ncbi:unnamed protein product [Clavelina lepadiformis]|uniref:PITH domain-containing protein n=1 Tax=Clavelina lepadiformis TaxID=159417 RepID=A0ABP0G0I5_CLALP
MGCNALMNRKMVLLEKFSNHGTIVWIELNLLRAIFTGSVKLKSVALLGGENDSHPKSMKLFKNIPNMDLDQTCKQPDQVFELPQTYTDVLQIPTKTARFSSVHHLSIFFPDNYGAETTKVYYIGLKGDYKQAQRQEVLITNYELAANPADHKNKLYDTSSHMIS